MALDYLTGDEISGKKKILKKAVSKAKGKVQKAIDKAKDKGIKLIPKKIIKVPADKARKAVLSAITLNHLKLATRIARLHKAGKFNAVSSLLNPFGITVPELKQAVSKGAKTQISGDSVGQWEQVAIAAVPIIIKLVEFFKKNKEAKLAEADERELENGVSELKGKLEQSPEFSQGIALMAQGSEVAPLKPEPTQGSFFSPLGICFKMIMMLMFIPPFENPVFNFIAEVLSLYAVVGFLIVFPLSFKYESVNKYFSIPVNLFYSIIGYGKKEKISY